MKAIYFLIITLSSLLATCFLWALDSLVGLNNFNFVGSYIGFFIASSAGAFVGTRFK